MPTIICKWCGKKHTAYNESKANCNRIECVEKEISANIELLKNCVAILLRNKIISTLEIRCPGNYTFGNQLKIQTETPIEVDLEGVNNDKIPTHLFAVELNKISNYFKPILRKGIKGNFFIKVANGQIDKIVLNDFFTPLVEPIIIGNNTIISQKYKGGI